MEKKRIRLRISYDGTGYCGWQIQPNAPTVEETLGQALFALLGEKIELIGASRTDAGVHAQGNVAVFDTTSPIPAGRMAYALNTRLPGDIVVTGSEEVPPGWHPRRHPCIKTYEYHMYTGRIRQPLLDRYGAQAPYALDVDRMRQAAGHLVGTHDFAGFCSAKTSVRSTVRTISSIELLEETPGLQGDGQIAAPFPSCGDGTGTPAQRLILRVRGNGFLYNMVRIIAGTLIEIGRGAADETAVTEVLRTGKRTKANTTAPARGLVLVDIDYTDERPVDRQAADTVFQK